MTRLNELLSQARTAIEPRLHEAQFRRTRRRAARQPSELDPRPTVSIVCVSNRPDQLDHIVSTWRSQVLVDVELVLVTNAAGYGPTARSVLDSVEGATIIETDPAITLGSALNLGIASSSGAVIAKVDDDDFYSPNYLYAGVELLRQTKAGVVGKKAHFVYLEATDETILRFPTGEHKRVGRVAGGTLMIHRQVAEEIAFRDVNVGEDTTFARDAEQAGWAVFSGGAPGYLQMRGTSKDHTWQPQVDHLLQGSRVVGSGNRAAYWQSTE